jgi:hypothetical protein
LHIGNGISISDQLVAEVTNIDIYEEECLGEGGRLGLGIGNNKDIITTSTTISTSIWDNPNTQLQNRIFGIFLNSQDDYLIKGRQPDRYSGSEITFGGIDSDHYIDCIHWHTPSNIYGTEHMWNIGLNRIVVNDDAVLPVNSYAKIESSTPGIIGPPSLIAPLLSMLGLICYNTGLDGDELFDEDCSNPNGFDVASIDCDRELPSIDFVMSDGTTYRLNSAHMVKSVYIDVCGTKCMVSINSDPDAIGFTFGEVFFHNYYVAFNVENHNIGIAKSIDKKNKTDPRCEADWPLDIGYYMNDNKNSNNDYTGATSPMSDTISIYFDSVKEWSRNNPTAILAATLGTIISILLLVFLTIVCRRIWRHRKYERADYDDEKAQDTTAEADADATEFDDDDGLL